jgi:gamma-glutamyltranspeptidase / glutathione hydrolase
MIMNLIDFGMDIQQAIAAPRISFVEPDVLGVEEGIPLPVREQLAKMGHHVRVMSGLGNGHGLMIEHDAAHAILRFQGGSDPRGEGKAAGY